ncbi:MAG: PTS sugar transporter subunit IIA [Lentisphaeria bacterium]|nr:PTS sugar transporter subunit IIA [Lentisphaeria bacterium]NQZ68650.1 PTS sugar transporter subunit IIA [Lentisphaeria bacterium]
MINISKILNEGQVVELSGSTRQELLRELTNRVAKLKLLSNPDALYLKLNEREDESSTAMGLGIAIPHARLSTIKETFMIVGRSKEGIDYGAPDSGPVHLFFMMGVSKNQSEYLNILQRITWIVRNDDLRSKLFDTADIANVYKLLSEH